MTLKLNSEPRLRYQLTAATFARMVANTAHRMFYPFLPVLSRGLGVSIGALTVMLSIRGALGMSAPLFGPIADRFGRRTAMLIGLAIFIASVALVGVYPNIVTVFAAMLLIIVSRFVFDPALQAYLSERTPYSRRGLVVALSEVGWSGAFLVGVPAVGLLIGRSGWHAPFLPIAAAGLLGAIWIALLVPSDGPLHGRLKAMTPGRWLEILRAPPVLGMLVVNMLLSGANESLGVVYGVWLEKSFALSVVQLGLTTTVIGAAELIGEGGVAVLSDRLGKRQALMLGLAVSAASYFALPLMSRNIEWALAGVFFAYLAFEFAIVAGIPLISELVPEARSTVMSMAVASHAAGRMMGALLGGWVFGFGFVWNGVAAGMMTLVGVPLILWVVRERG